MNLISSSILLIFIFWYGNISAQIIIPNGSISSQATITVATVPSAYPSTLNINYVRTWQPNIPITDASLITSLSPVDVTMQTQYVDGLGRILQTVSKGITPGLKDVVAPVIYDDFGREVYQYLPYVSSGSDGNFKTSPFTEQQTFMQQQYGTQGETFFYGKTDYEASPLNRVSKSMAPGNSWVGSNRGAEIKYWVNTLIDDVKMWDVTDVLNDFGTYTKAGSYPAGELYKIVTIDEHGKQVEDFKDKEGKVILKKIQLTAAPDDGSGSGYTNWLCTYYVYDDLDNLRCVIQPGGVELISSDWSLNDSRILNEQCFRYEYDERNRMIMKKVPGATEVYMLYDKKDRLVFSQDGNMRIKNWWMTYLYGVLNRPVAKGITVAVRQQLKDQLNIELFTASNISSQGLSGISDISVDNFIAGTTSYQASSSITFNPGFTSDDGADFVAEIISTSSSLYNIEIAGNPVPSDASFAALTLSYYDNYSFTQKRFDNTDNAKLSSGANHSPEFLPSSESQLTKGINTGTKVWVLEDANDLSKGRWIESVTFYDNKGRSVQTQSDNFKAGLEKITNRYDFAGNIICTYKVHNNPAASVGIIRVKTNADYDHAGRLLTITKQINDDAASNKLIVQNEYDELGQLKNKSLGTNPVNNSQPLESLAYEYNIRGWLKGINRDYVNNASNTNYFGQTLSYNIGFTSSQYTGNIAGLQWRSKGDGEQRSYGFDYDAVNRILKADFTQNNGGWNTNAGVDFSVSNLSYDANGNIKTIKQKGLKLNGSLVIDSLIYNYIPASNRLLNVIDGVNDVQTKMGDFRTSVNHPVQNKTISTTDYTYDDNGNLKKDLNKDIGNASTDGIEYNHLNLPYRITIKNLDGTNKGTIEYLYDAAGVKLEKKVTEGSLITTTNYFDGFEYRNDTLQFASHEEGRIRYNSSNNTFVYDYFLKDHLGNVRAVLTDEQQTDAYPPASMELSESAIENTFYSNIDATRTGLPGSYPTDTYTNPNDKVAKTNGNGNRIGPSIVLKVMAGDKFNLRANSWYKLNGSIPGTPVDPLTDLLSILTNGVNNSGGKITQVELTNSGVLTPSASEFLNNESNNYNFQKPKAYVNWILLDEQFKYVSSSSGFEQVGADNEFTTHIKSDMLIYKNGYLYIYVSNETPNIDVFFDNLQVTLRRGPLLETNEFYPYGLRQEMVSYKAFKGNGFPSNKKLFISQSFDDDLGCNYYQMKWRTMDPQIGRFLQVDPVAALYAHNSPYDYAENKPINGIDLEGLEWQPINKAGEGIKPEDNENINGYRWVGFDLNNKTGEKIAKAGTVPTAYTFGEEGRTALGVDRNGNAEVHWENYSSLSTGDAASDRKISTLHSSVQNGMKEFILKAQDRYGIKLRVTDGFRTVAEQDKKYAQGRTDPGNRVTNARGGYSNHNFGLAIDVVPIQNGQANYGSNQYPLLGRIGQSVGLEWGGNFKSITDMPHFQNLQGLSLAQLRALPKDESGLPILPQQ